MKEYQSSARIAVIRFMGNIVPVMMALCLMGCIDVKDGDGMVYHWEEEAYLYEWVNETHQKLLFDPVHPVLTMYKEDHQIGQWTYILQDDDETLVKVQEGKIAGFDRLVYDRIEDDHHFKACLKGYTGNTLTDIFIAEETE